jgi:hypothetical protein
MIGYFACNPKLVILFTTHLNLRSIMAFSSGNLAVAKRTGAVARPSCRSAAAGFPATADDEDDILTLRKINKFPRRSQKSRRVLNLFLRRSPVISQSWGRGRGRGHHKMGPGPTLETDFQTNHERSPTP